MVKTVVQGDHGQVINQQGKLDMEYVDLVDGTTNYEQSGGDVKGRNLKARQTKKDEGLAVSDRLNATCSPGGLCEVSASTPRGGKLGALAIVSLGTPSG
jgi:hypothetical protein